ncbi:MAG: hypothetical protein R2827_05820 [Bdellovibrionales bacterium]
MSPYLLKRELPRSNFAMNTALLGKLMVLNSLYIETIASMDGELVMAPYKYRGRTLFRPRLAAEFKRRNIPIILMPSKEEPPPWLKQLAIGQVVDNSMD